MKDIGLACLLHRLRHWPSYLVEFRRFNLYSLSDLKDYLQNNSILDLDIDKFNIYYQEIIEDLLWQKSADQHIITYENPAYPYLLKQINDAPYLLYVKGSLSCLNQPSLAIVGSRKATPAGLQITHEWSEKLALNGLTIISGLAFGVDVAAHNGSFSANQPSLAVMPAGLSHITPKSNLNIAENILKSGALVSEIPPSVTPQPHHFARRNRIISGMSLGCLVIEAQIPSGTLITARHCLEQNRALMAVPGSIYNIQSQGCIELIKQGATCVSTVSDVLRALNLPAIELLDSIDYKDPVLNSIDFVTTTLNVIIKRSRLPESIVLHKLSSLYCKNYIKPWQGGWVRLR